MDVAVFLGGADLEMSEIARLLRERPEIDVHDHGLAWGAAASSYEPHIRIALTAGRTAVLVELTDDLPADLLRDRLTFIDHHGPAAGRDRPTSIEQIFRLFGFPPER